MINRRRFGGLGWPIKLKWVSFQTSHRLRCSPRAALPEQTADISLLPWRLKSLPIYHCNGSSSYLSLLCYLQCRAEKVYSGSLSSAMNLINLVSTLKHVEIFENGCPTIITNLLGLAWPGIYSVLKHGCERHTERISPAPPVFFSSSSSP